MSVKQVVERVAREQGIDPAQLAQKVVEQQDDAAWSAWSHICGLAGDEPETIDNSLAAQWLRRST
ncbi:MAG: hypothetical protein ABI783_03780 [Actinomycetota bacterium]